MRSLRERERKVGRAGGGRLVDEVTGGGEGGERRGKGEESIVQGMGGSWEGGGKGGGESNRSRGIEGSGGRGWGAGGGLSQWTLLAFHNFRSASTSRSPQPRFCLSFSVSFFI